ncbi:2-isopropylmalate synthase [Coprococcus sp. OM04-5BH]|uniref:2-isopropylmalate synthase n=1 Tax=Coprococcus sp. OM04-5BH TaxID=2293093 RepID=UPI000E4D9A1E|nr:2-isopropylmalate synthase [Coprococcus sp. OM04-5BH]RHV34806.1 2-isopropylmalate synthase [Coprococcus sp. OM04-5BH]
MKNYEHYKRGYYMPPEKSTDWVNKEYIDKAPIWCSVDLRDGNQALIVPMNLEDKLEFFKTLVDIGFKEIEIGFPAASETEYEFCRTLIENDLIPDDVTIQVLTQARPHIIEKTFKAIDGAKHAIVHLYNSTSFAQRQQVFKKSKEEILKIAVDGAKLLNKMAADYGVNYPFEYSPESFTGTEIDYALEVCNAVIEEWKPTPDRKVIINLPATVEMSLPHVYASQIEYMSKHLKYRENVVLSLHPHNDRGCGVADAELGILAGADRIEGTLFGNGERTGNVDVITLCMNMFTHGVDPKLDLSDIPKLTELYERVTNMHVYERSPYTGKLVFAAFSGSHQDAIAKGMKFRKEQGDGMWTVPYLPLNPEDIGRKYDGDVIRINSQSGKGGIGYILQTKYGFDLPAKFREDLGYTVKDVSDKAHKELSPREVLEIFQSTYVNIEAPIKLLENHFIQRDGISTEISIEREGVKKVYHGHGNGRLDAVSNAIKKHFEIDFKVVCYEEHSLQMGSNSQAVAYVGIETEDGTVFGAGIKDDIIDASVQALISAVNRSGKI